MKYYESSFVDYLNAVQQFNCHPKMLPIYTKLWNQTNNMCNCIFYGPSGTGKYTQVLLLLSQFSPSKLQHERNILVTFPKSEYKFKISDVHCEVDMNLIGCNSKLIWNEIYSQYLNIVKQSPLQYGFIVCKNFHEVQSELLDIIYGYQEYNSPIKFIFITEQLSFITSNILKSSLLLRFPRPSKTAYLKILKSKPLSIINTNALVNVSVPVDVSTFPNLKHVKNIKWLKYSSTTIVPHQHICNSLLTMITNLDTISLSTFREKIYEISIYQLNIHDCVQFILQQWFSNVSTDTDKDVIQEVIRQTFQFFHNYNNNYRSIYHIEYYLLSIGFLYKKMVNTVK